MKTFKDKISRYQHALSKLNEIIVLWTLNSNTKFFPINLFSFFFSVICEECNSYVRLVFTLTPGISAVIALVIVGLCFKSKLVLSCGPRGKFLVIRPF